MSLSSQDSLVYLMIVTAASDSSFSNVELDRISALVERLPIFENYSTEQLSNTAADCIKLMGEVENLETIIDIALKYLPNKLHDTAYALCVEIAAVDLELEQTELRWLEMVRDKLSIDRLTTAAIEVAARARLRKG